MRSSFSILLFTFVGIAAVSFLNSQTRGDVPPPIPNSLCMPVLGECGGELGAPAGMSVCPGNNSPCGQPCNRCTGSLDPAAYICMQVYGETQNTCQPNGNEVDCGLKKLMTCQIVHTGGLTICQCPDPSNGVADGDCHQVLTCR